MHPKPKKYLGQNFLIDKNIQRKIIEGCAPGPKDIVLEIGSGRGEITKLISQRAAKVYAIEIDEGLYKALKSSLKDCPNAKIIHKDILKFNFRNYSRREKKKLKIVGNIPYYITTPIIQRLMEYKDSIEAVFITVQKEFAQRMTACPGSKDYGSLSCYVQYYFEPRIIFTIKNTCFWPRPKVDSSFVRLDIKAKTMLGKKQERLFFKIIRAAFNQRRKTLRNSLKNIIPKNKLAALFNKYGLSPDIRPESLSLQSFARLASL